MVEGEAAVVTVKAKANPDQIKYKWSRNNTPLKIKPKKLFFDGPVLNFTEVGRKDRGTFLCEASNSEGATIYTIDLDVQCKLSLVAFSLVCLARVGVRKDSMDGMLM